MTTALTCSVQETADLLGVSERHVRHLVERDVLAKVPHLGRAVRIPRVAVEALVASAMPASVSSSAAPTADGSLADAGIGAASDVAAVGEVDPTTGRSTSEQGDGPARQGEAIEERGALSASQAG